MSSRQLIISNPSKLSTSVDQLIVSKEQGSISLPLADIGSILIESREVSVSSPLLSKCAEHNISVISCDEKHLPCGVYIPFNQHSVFSKRLKQQIQFGTYQQKAIWRRLIIKKITNQSNVLSANDKKEIALELTELTLFVKLGDPDNIEGIAARKYFSALFGSSFSRDKHNTINAALNYGYALLRALIARQVVLFGLQPALGIHHDNQFNQFNLVDDFIEPFRPVVDYFVIQFIDDQTDFCSEHRKKLLGIFEERVLIDKKKYLLTDAVQLMISNYVDCLDSMSSKLTEIPVVFPRKK